MRAGVELVRVVVVLGVMVVVVLGVMVVRAGVVLGVVVVVRAVAITSSTGRKCQPTVATQDKDLRNLGGGRHKPLVTDVGRFL